MVLGNMCATPGGGWRKLSAALLPEGTLSRTTGVRNDHCLLIMLGGRGPGSVALFSSIAFDRRRNSCSKHWTEHAMRQICAMRRVCCVGTGGQADG